MFILFFALLINIILIPVSGLVILGALFEILKLKNYKKGIITLLVVVPIVCGLVIWPRFCVDPSQDQLGVELVNRGCVAKTLNPTGWVCIYNNKEILLEGYLPKTSRRIREIEKQTDANKETEANREKTEKIRKWLESPVIFDETP